MQKPLWDNAFAELTPESAYWVGMLLTDGCVFWPKNRPSARIFLRQSSRCLAHVERFRSFLRASNAIVAHRHRDPSGVERHTVCLAVTSRKLALDLARFGVVPKKSASARASEDLIERPEFWRGVIDGDGCVYHTSRFYYSGSEALGAQFVAYVRTFTPTFEPCVLRQPGCIVIYVRGQTARSMLRAMYLQTDLCLPEKRARALGLAA